MPEGNPQNMLRAIAGPLAGATFEVGTRLLIGRVPACDVVLADVEVSREHAMIVSDGTAPTLVDLASSNGTLVDGEKIGRVVLRPGMTFTICSSEFVFDRAPPVSTRPVLASQLGIPRDPPADALDGRPTQELPAAGSAAPLALAERPTRRGLEAIRPLDESARTSTRPTVQLESATADLPDGERPTVQLRAVEGETSRVSTKPTPPESAPVVFAPPPPPMPKKPEVVAERESVEPPALVVGPYAGDLLADITDYRAFRLRLQRGEIPTGEEVVAMIDLEAVLREPPAESSHLRDVITQRFFRRFPFGARVCARFAVGRDVFEVEGAIKNLSVDGLQCVLDFGAFNPEPNQLARLVVDHTRGFLDVRYSIAARIVYRRKDMAGFVFAGVPSWSERGEFQHVETAVRGRSED